MACRWRSTRLSTEMSRRYGQAEPGLEASTRMGTQMSTNMRPHMSTHMSTQIWVLGSDTSFLTVLAFSLAKALPPPSERCCPRQMGRTEERFSYSFDSSILIQIPLIQILVIPGATEHSRYWILEDLLQSFHFLYSRPIRKMTCRKRHRLATTAPSLVSARR